MKNKNSKLATIAIKKFMTKAITENAKSARFDSQNINETRLPDEFVRQMINHADKFTSKRIRFHIWETNLDGKFKNCKALINELKQFIPKEKHKVWMEFVEVLKKTYLVN